MKQDSKFDLLRLLACLMVIAMHRPLPDSAEGNGLFLSTLSYLTAPCIGLFFMVSALLLPVRTGASISLKRRFGKILFPTLFWSLFYLGCNTLMRDESIDWLRTLGFYLFHHKAIRSCGSCTLWIGIILIGSCFELMVELCESDRNRELFELRNQPMFPHSPSSSKYQYRRYWNSLLLYGLRGTFCLGILFETIS